MPGARGGNSNRGYFSEASVVTMLCTSAVKGEVRVVEKPYVRLFVEGHFDHIV
jgi:hypothetical protein